MENEDNKPIAKNGADKRQSAWKRFMTLYTTLYAFLLPLVVFITLVCQLLFRKWCGFILFDLLCFVPFFAIYLLSVCISLVLIPAILIGIKTHDNAVREKGNNRRFTKSRGKHQESKFSLFCKGFRYSFLGEIIYILLYVVLFGVLITLLFALFFLLPNLLQYCAQAILPHSEPVVSVHDSGQSGWGGLGIAMLIFALNILLFCVFLAVFFYVLIRRLGSYQIRQFRAYRRQKARRKERLTKIRNEQQTPPSDSPEQQEGVDDDKAENEF